MFTVLIAEDEPLIRKGIIYCTDWAKLDCAIPLEASNGEEAAEMIRQHRPDIVLLDVNMPLMDGLDALLQTKGLYYFVPIVVTGYADFDYAKRAMYSGVQRYLLKPVATAELEEAIRFAQQKVEKHRMMTRELARQTDVLQKLGELPEQQGKSQPVRQVMAYVAEHYPEKITIGRMSEQFHYSETLLIRRFKSETGINFSEYLTHFRLQKAIAMMRESDMSISQIAEACGFSEYRYFRVVFQKKIGCSPAQYSQEVRLMRNDGNECVE